MEMWRIVILIQQTRVLKVQHFRAACLGMLQRKERSHWSWCWRLGPRNQPRHSAPRRQRRGQSTNTRRKRRRRKGKKESVKRYACILCAVSLTMSLSSALQVHIYIYIYIYILPENFHVCAAWILDIAKLALLKWSSFYISNFHISPWARSRIAKVFLCSSTTPEVQCLTIHVIVNVILLLLSLTISVSLPTTVHFGQFPSKDSI